MIKNVKQILKNLLANSIKYLKNNYKQISIYLIAILIISFVFFQYAPIIPPDSGYYYYLSLIIRGIEPLSSWYTVRGPILPTYISFFSIIFKNQVTAVVCAMLVQYLLNLYLLYKVMNIIKNKNSNKLRNTLYIIFIMINPLMFGYGHTLLTEIIAPTIIIFSCFIAFKWEKNEWNIKNKKTWLYLILIILIGSISWFLKQPYFIACYAPFIISFLISLIKKQKYALYKIIPLILCVLCVLINIKIWDYYLNKAGNVSDSSSMNGTYISKSLIGALNSYFIIEKDISVCDLYNENQLDLFAEKEKKLITKKTCNKFTLLNIKDLNGKTIEYDLIKDYDQISSINAIKILLIQIGKHPWLVINSYFNNYMAMIDIFPTNITNNEYKPIRQFAPVNNENANLAFVTYTNVPIHWWGYDNPKSYDELNEEYVYIKHMKDFELWNNYSNESIALVSEIYPIYTCYFKLIFLLLPCLVVIQIIKFFKEKSLKNTLLLILYGTSVCHLLFHTVTGAIIDRYAYVVYPISILSIIINFTIKEEVKNDKKSSKKRKINIHNPSL